MQKFEGFLETLITVGTEMSRIVGARIGTREITENHLEVGALPPMKFSYDLINFLLEEDSLLIYFGRFLLL